MMFEEVLSAAETNRTLLRERDSLTRAITDLVPLCKPLRPALVNENVAPAPAVSHAAPAPVPMSEHVAPAPAVTHGKPSSSDRAYGARHYRHRHRACSCESTRDSSSCCHLWKASSSDRAYGARTCRHRHGTFSRARRHVSLHMPSPLGSELQ